MTLHDELSRLAEKSPDFGEWRIEPMPDCDLHMIWASTCFIGRTAFAPASRQHAELIVALRNNLPAILAALEAVEWRPISEAPKDGTVILVFGGIAHWHDGRWKTLTGTEYPGLEIEWPVTHWLPLPSPPKETT